MRIAIIADIHENLPDLEKALSIIKQKKCDKVVCLGDIVGMSIPYYTDLIPHRNASKVLAIVHEECDLVVKGNHDYFASRSLPKISSFSYNKHWYDLDYSERKELAAGRVRLYEECELDTLLSYAELNILREFPEYELMSFEMGKILYSHFLYPDLSGSLVNSLEEKKYFFSHFNFMQSLNAQISFIGHTHFNLGAAIVNPKKSSIVVPFQSSAAVKFDNNIIVCPSLVRKGAKGFVIFDPSKMHLECIKVE